MAKKKQQEPELSPEEQKEQEELKKRFEEKEKKKKEQAKLLKKKEKLEIKKIRSKINFPYKLLLLVSLLCTLFAFIVLFFGASLSPMDSLYYTFMVFTGIYLGGGIIMMLLFYLVSEEKLIEIENEKQLKERLKEEEKRREEEEFAKLVQTEKDFAKRKAELQDERRVELETAGEEIQEHILEFEEEETKNTNALKEAKTETEETSNKVDLSKLPEIKLEGMDMGFTDFNDRDIEKIKQTTKIPKTTEQEYTLDDLNFDFNDDLSLDMDKHTEAIELDMK